MSGSGRFYDLLASDADRETGSLEDPADVHIDGYVAARQLANVNTKIPLQDFDGHGCLLLTHAIELQQSLLQLPCRRRVRPDIRCIARVISHDSSRCPHYPFAANLGIPMRHWSLSHGSPKCFGIRRDPFGRQRPYSVLKNLRRIERALSPDTLVEQYRDEKRKWIYADQVIGLWDRAEATLAASERSTKFKQRPDDKGFVPNT